MEIISTISANIAYIAAAFGVFIVITYGFLRVVQRIHRDSLQGLSFFWDSQEIREREDSALTWFVWGTVIILAVVAGMALILYPLFIH